MKRLIWVVAFGLLLFGAPKGATAQEEQECFPPCRDGYICHPVRLECVEPCNPPCREGYICDAARNECVSACNPPCGPGERCTDSGECVAEFGVERVPASPPPGAAPAVKEVGDRRFRFGILGRFGFAGKQKLTSDFVEGEFEFDAATTLGFDLRFEKPPAKYVTAGVVMSSYWFQADGDPERDYALDVSPFVKPRYPLELGSKEAEVYVIIQVGGTFAVLDETNWGGFFSDFLGGGFNFSVAPGFQAFVGESVALIVEIGYAYTWLKVGGGDYTLTFGQPTVRFGIVRAF